MSSNNRNNNNNNNNNGGNWSNNWKRDHNDWDNNLNNYDHISNDWKKINNDFKNINSDYLGKVLHSRVGTNVEHKPKKRIYPILEEEMNIVFELDKYPESAKEILSRRFIDFREYLFKYNIKEKEAYTTTTWRENFWKIYVDMCKELQLPLLEFTEFDAIGK